jgi:hypothetical protein
MPEILELPEILRRVSPLTVEEYHRLGEFNDNTVAISEASIQR